MLTLGILCAIGSLVVISIVDTLIKRVTASLGTYLTSTLFFLLPLPALFVIMAIIPPVSIAPIYVLFAIAGGIANAIGLILILKTLETEQAANTWALVNIGQVPVILLGIFVLAEHINLAETLGILAVVIGSMMVTITEDWRFNRKLIPAIVGNVLLAFYFILTVYSVAMSPGAYTLIFPLAYGAGLVVLLLYGAFTSKLVKALKRLRRSRVLPLALTVGLMGGVSLGLWIFVIVLKTVALGGAIGVFEPALVVVLAYLVYKEKLTPLQLIGVIVSLAGALAVSLL